MRPSDLLLDFGRPVAYYPGLVKVMGSPHAVIFFSQIFYWQDKAHAEEGVHKTREAIEVETGLTFDQQATARKQLVSRGILKETHKRLEHRVYFRVDCERLDEIINENNGVSRNGETSFREDGKADFGKQENPSPRTRENPRRESGKSIFDPTEITTKTTTEIKNTLGASAGAATPTAISGSGKSSGKTSGTKPAARQEYSPEFEAAWQAYPKRAGGNPKGAAFKHWKARLAEGATPQAILDGVRRYAVFIRATGKLGTEYVKQAATFFGPDRHFEEPWTPPAAPNASGGARNVLMPGDYRTQNYGDANPDFLR